MRMLERMLIDAGVSFEWDCYGDTSTSYAKRIITKFKHIKFKGVTNTPTEVVKQYDYLVQLSDTEGYPYSIYEALAQKVPVIVTDFPSIHEMVIDGVNGYILKRDNIELDVNKLLTIPVITEFKEKSTEKDWINFLDMATKKTAQKGTAKTTGHSKAKGSTQAQSETVNVLQSNQTETNPVSKQDVVNALNEKGQAQANTNKPAEKTVAVKVTRRYHDTLLDKVLEVGATHEVTEKRAKELKRAKVAEIAAD